MGSFLNNQQIHNHTNQMLDTLPEEAMRRMPDAINAKNNVEQAPSLLSTAGWSAGATGVFNSNAVIQNRQKPLAAKMFKGGNNLSQLASYGKAVKNIGVGAGVGTLMTAPTEYIVGKMSDKYKDDKEFHGGHFASIAVPAAISGTIGTGSFINTMNQMGNSGNIGTKQMIKNIVSPTKILETTGKEMRNVTSMFKTKKFGAGLLAAGMMGISALEPLAYINQTKKEPGMEKEASVKSKASKIKAKAADYLERRRRLGLGVIATGTYFGAKDFVEDKKKKVSDHARGAADARRHIFSEPGLLY